MTQRRMTLLSRSDRPPMKKPKMLTTLQTESKNECLNIHIQRSRPISIENGLFIEEKKNISMNADHFSKEHFIINWVSGDLIFLWNWFQTYFKKFDISIRDQWRRAHLTQTNLLTINHLHLFKQNYRFTKKKGPNSEFLVHSHLFIWCCFLTKVGASEFRGVKIVDSEIILPYQLTNTHRLVFFFSLTTGNRKRVDI